MLSIKIAGTAVRDGELSLVGGVDNNTKNTERIRTVPARDVWTGQFVKKPTVPCFLLHQEYSLAIPSHTSPLIMGGLVSDLSLISYTSRFCPSSSPAPQHLYTQYSHAVQRAVSIRNDLT